MHRLHYDEAAIGYQVAKEVARLHYRITCLRDDVLHKLTTRLANCYGIIGLEDLNLKGLLNVSRAVLPLMVERGTGHVVNIGSTAGHQVYPGGNVYNATKFGVKALSEGMNLDVAGTQVRVSSVDPGHVESEFALVRFHGDAERAKKIYEGFRPLSPDDVADAVSYVVNAPEHVNIADLIILPAAQRSVHLIDREK